MENGFQGSCGLFHSSRGAEGKVCGKSGLFLRKLNCVSCPPKWDLVKTGKHKRTYFYPPKS